MVVGDSGVGKTALVHLLCHGDVLSNPSWTIGCSVELFIFPRDCDSAGERHFFELWDVGGSASHKNARAVFYDNPHGIILVHDLTNKKSEANLHKWLAELSSTNA